MVELKTIVQLIYTSWDSSSMFIGESGKLTNNFLEARKFISDDEAIKYTQKKYPKYDYILFHRY